MQGFKYKSVELGGMLGNRLGSSEGHNFSRYRIKGAASGQCIL